MTGWRLPAEMLEAVIRRVIADHVTTAAASHRLLATPDLRSDETPIARAQDLARSLQGGDAAPLRALLRSASLGKGALDLSLDRAALSDRLGVAQDSLAPEAVSMSVPFALRRRGAERKLLAGAREATSDPALRKALTDAHRWAGALRNGNSPSPNCPDRWTSRCPSPDTHAAGFPLPRNQRAILDGTQPVELTLERLVRQTLPLDWADQERLYGL